MCFAEIMTFLLFHSMPFSERNTHYDLNYDHVKHIKF